jgi:photosystem II stability/assembly factor-like uncharacterized protein
VRTPWQVCTNGTYWRNQTSGVTGTLYGVKAWNHTHVMAVGQTGTILATSDGGVTWVKQTTKTNTTLFSVAAVSETNWLAAGSGGTILSTTNAYGNGNWTIQNEGVSVLRSIYVTTGPKIWVVGDVGKNSAWRACADYCLAYAWPCGHARSCARRMQAKSYTPRLGRLGLRKPAAPLKP